MLTAAGYGYRLHGKGMPGKPDLVFKGRRKVIFVHGCFWHQHEREECLDGRRPKSNTGYWYSKLARNVKRDQEHIRRLTEEGWQVEVVWECEAKSSDGLMDRLRAFLGPPSRELP